MSNATAEIPMANADDGGRKFHLPVNSGTQIYKGTLVAQLAASGKVVPFSTALSGPAIGKATHDVLGDGTNRCLIESECKYRIANGAGANAFSEATPYGVPVYGSDDHTASLTSVGDTLKRIGWFQGMEPSGDGRVLVHVSTFDYSAAAADIGEIPPLNIVAVRGTTTANVASLAAFTVAGVDGLTYVEGERVLLGNAQTDATQRGPYRVGAVVVGVAPLTRVLDANGSPEISSGMIVHVSEGTVNADRYFFLSTNAPITVDTTSLSFTQLPSYADLASTAASLGANLVGYQDAGAFTAADDVDEALDELYQHTKSVQKQVNIPLTSALDVATGALLAVFAGGASTTPGTQLTDSKSAAVRWNNDAAPGAIAVNVAMPQDLDDTADVVFHALVSKTGATLGDATSLTVGAFEHTVGALHDADVDFGGATSAVVGNAAAKTVTEVTLTLALANVNPTPSSLCLTIKPTAGLLGTDDFILHSAWLEYKGKLLTT